MGLSLSCWLEVGSLLSMGCACPHSLMMMMMMIGGVVVPVLLIFVQERLVRVLTVS